MDETKQLHPDWHNVDEAARYGERTERTEPTEHELARWANEIVEYGAPLYWTVWDERDGLVPVFHDPSTYSGEFLFGHTGLRVDLSLSF